MPQRLTNILAACCLFLLALPGQGEDLWICLGADGHIEISATAIHECDADSHASDDLHADDHGDCLDTILCRPELIQLALPSASSQTCNAPQPAPQALPVCEPTLAPRQLSPPAGNLPIHHWQTIRLLI